MPSHHPQGALVMRSREFSTSSPDSGVVLGPFCLVLYFNRFPFGYARAMVLIGYCIMSLNHLKLSPGHKNTVTLCGPRMRICLSEGGMSYRCNGRLFTDSHYMTLRSNSCRSTLSVVAAARLALSYHRPQRTFLLLSN